MLQHREMVYQGVTYSVVRIDCIHGVMVTSGGPGTNAGKRWSVFVEGAPLVSMYLNSLVDLDIWDPFVDQVVTRP